MPSAYAAPPTERGRPAKPAPSTPASATAAAAQSLTSKTDAGLAAKPATVGTACHAACPTGSPVTAVTPASPATTTPADQPPDGRAGEGLAAKRTAKICRTQAAGLSAKESPSAPSVAVANAEAKQTRSTDKQQPTVAQRGSPAPTRRA